MVQQARKSIRDLVSLNISSKVVNLSNQHLESTGYMPTVNYKKSTGVYKIFKKKKNIVECRSNSIFCPKNKASNYGVLNTTISKRKRNLY